MPDYDIKTSLTVVETAELNGIMLEHTDMARQSFIHPFVTRLIQEAFDSGYVMGGADERSLICDYKKSDELAYEEGQKNAG